MRRALDFLGITRAKGSPRPKLLTAVVGGFGVFFVIFGGAVIAGWNPATPRQSGSVAH